MLVLNRKELETIHIGDAVITILATGPTRVSVGIEAPQTTKILRGELLERDEREQEAA